MVSDLERKIYSPWAFSGNESEKAKINREIYEEIKEKAKVKLIRKGYNHNVYTVVDNPEGLSTLELALIAARGNLCFGHRVEGDKIIINTD